MRTAQAHLPVPHLRGQERIGGLDHLVPGQAQRLRHAHVGDHGAPRADLPTGVQRPRRQPDADRAAVVDEQLWNRGQGARYKPSPRHRSRCTAY